jgi:phosphopantothenoylcysteine decarboxylase/phosphopantothenate--cysteine ligase
VIEPAVGRLTGKDSGPGRLPEPEQIFDYVVDVLGDRAARTDLAGRRVVVSAGGTREYLDPVRFLGNRSSGKQGYALAAAAAARGADVTLVAANVTLDDPAGVTVRRVVSASELDAAMRVESRGADAVVMAAAPADFRPATSVDHKIKKRADGQAPTIELVENPDILAGLVAPAALASGFPCWSASPPKPGMPTQVCSTTRAAKLARKGCDLLVVNDVSGGGVFGSDDNQAVILSSGGDETKVEHGSKRDLAHVIWDHVRQILPEPGTAP